jgi:hypothetical protein
VGDLLIAELSGLWSFKVRRFRIIYELHRKARVLRVFAIGHRRGVYEQLAERLRQVGEHKYYGCNEDKFLRV